MALIKTTDPDIKHFLKWPQNARYARQKARSDLLQEVAKEEAAKAK